MTHDPRRANNSRTGGFSFAEVMFAVVILGIGFILVAAIFPVAIQQSQATGEESWAAAIGRAASSTVTELSSVVQNPNVPAAGQPIVNPSQTVQTFPLFPPTVKPYVPGNINIAGTGTSPAQLSVAPPAIVVPFSGGQYEAIKGNTILPSDPRYGYSLFYSRENGSSSMNLYVIALTNRQRPIYDPTVDTVTTVGTASAYTARNMIATPTGTVGRRTTIAPDTITLTGGTVAEGYTVGTTAGSLQSQSTGKPSGRYYRIGRQLGAALYEIDPGNNLSLTAGSGGLWNTIGGVGDTPLNGDQVKVYPQTTMQAQVAYAMIFAVPNSPGGRIILTSSPNGALLPPPSATTGAFIIVADDFPSDPTRTPITGVKQGYSIPPNLLPTPGGISPSSQYTYSVGVLNGRIFRLGKPVTDDFEQNGAAYPVGTFDLDPQYGMRPPSQSQGGVLYSPDTVPPAAFQAPGSPYYSQPLSFPNFGTIAKVYVIGMGKDASGAYGKEAQDIGVYTTTVPVQ